MKAMLLAAGLGTRLRPLTDEIPKALVEVNGITLLEHSVNHLKKYRVNQVIINVHHFAEQIIDYLGRKNNFGMEITISDESGELLDTGGGLKKAAWFFKDGLPFIVRNVDVLSDLDLNKLVLHHFQKKGLATLVVRERETSRYFLFNEKLQLCGWENTKTVETRITIPASTGLKQLAFSGIQIIDPKIFDLVTETGKFSLTEMYLRLSYEHKIFGFIDKDSFWLDAGKKMSNEQ
jgi:N-acetyl-alpha-D-muramate 1-phosphate uridylyltransferase